MKKYLFLLLIFMAVPARSSENTAGVVVLVNGEAWLERGGDRKEISVGSEILPMDVLVTGKRGRVKVLFSDDSLLSLGSKSRVMVTRHIFDPQQKKRSTAIDLMGGKLRALVQKVVIGLQADFQVKAATAVAGVRGTEFVVVYEENQLQLYTLSGEVAFASEGSEPVLVAAGQKSRIQDGKPALAEAVASAELENLRQETEGEYQLQAVAMAQAPKAQDSLGEIREGLVISAESDRHPNQQESYFGEREYDGGFIQKEPGINPGDNRYEGYYNAANNDGTGEFQIGGTWKNPNPITSPEQELVVRINLIRK